MKEFLKNRPVFVLGAVRLGELRVRHHRHGRFLSRVLPEVLEHRRRLDRDHVAPRLRQRRSPGSSIALLAPILGAIGDRGGAPQAIPVRLDLVRRGRDRRAVFRRRRASGSPPPLLFVLATMGFNGGVVFNDSLLLDVAKPGELDRVSAFGYSLGYLGGGLLFLVNVLMVQQARRRSASRTPRRRCRFRSSPSPSWWLLFTIPADARRARAAARAAPRHSPRPRASGFRELGATIAHVRQYHTIVMFLVAYWFYIDGVNTIIKMAVNYGVSLGLDTSSLLTALLVTQFVGFPAALFFGYLGDRIGPKRGILIGLVVYAGITVYAYFLDSVARVLRARRDRGPGAGRRAEPVAFVVRPPGARGQERGVLRLLQHDGQVRDGARAAAHRHRRRRSRTTNARRSSRWCCCSWSAAGCCGACRIDTGEDLLTSRSSVAMSWWLARGPNRSRA